MERVGDGARIRLEPRLASAASPEYTPFIFREAGSTTSLGTGNSDTDPSTFGKATTVRNCYRGFSQASTCSEWQIPDITKTAAPYGSSPSDFISRYTTPSV